MVLKPLDTSSKVALCCVSQVMKAALDAVSTQEVWCEIDIVAEVLGSAALSLATELHQQHKA